MTRIASGSDIKRGAMFVAGEKPREGSRLRSSYDRLRSGEVVRLGWMAEQLTNMYGMELKRTDGGSRLVGEWDGPYFVPVECLGDT